MQGATTITAKVADALYTEALLLADETRAYLDGRAADDGRALPPHLRVVFACEGLNATTRLMHSVAALLARKAGGSPSRHGYDEIVASHAAEARQLPLEAQRLFAAGEELFARVRRLEGAVEPAVHNPARALLHRLERAI